jgi:hypothetical protein
MQLHSMCIQKPIKLCNYYGLTYRATMARKSIKNIDMLWLVKRATFLGFIGKIVNIYVIIFSFILF